MHHIGKNVTTHNTPVGNTKCVSRLNIFHFTQLQGFAAQQPAQTGPTGDTEYDAKKQQTQISACGNSIEPLGPGFYVYLHHQYRRRDQQDTRDGTQCGIQILNNVIYPATEIARHDAKKQRKGQHHQRGKRSDHKSGANAFQRLVEYVLSHLVGTENMIVAA